MNFCYAENMRRLLLIMAAVLFGWMCLSVLPLFLDKPLFLIALPVAGMLGVVMALRPELCLILVLLSRSVVEPLLEKTKMEFLGQQFGAGLFYNLVVILLCAILCATKSSYLSRVPFKRLWLMFLLFIGLTIFYAPDKGSAIKLWENFLSYFAMFVIPFLIINNEQDRNFWFKIFAWSFVLPVLVSDFDFISRSTVSAVHGWRLQGTFTHPNILAFYMMLGMAMVLYALKHRSLPFNKLERGLLALLAINMLVEIIAAKTRGAWIAVGLMFFMYGLMADRRVIFFLLVMMPLLLFVPSVSERIGEVFTSSNRTLEQGMNSWEWRLLAWQSSLDLIFKNPLFGYGLASFVPLSIQFFPSDEGIGAHNTYLQVLFEGGLVGLGLFLALLGGVVTVLYKNWQANRQAASAVVFVFLLSYMLTCFADNLLYYLVLNWYVWFFVGFGLRAEQLKLVVE